MTTNVSAGLDSSNVELTYKVETTYKEKPTGNYATLRLTSEGFSEAKTRTRPDEIRADGQASQARTTQVSATGSLSGGLSAGTYDDFLRAMINAGAFSAAGTAASASGTMTGGGVLSQNNIDTKFAVGDHVRVAGFNNEGNNGIFRVTARSNDSITLAGPSASFTSETRACTVKSGGRVRNGVVVDTFEVQKEMASNLFLYYPGSYVTGGTISAELGALATVNFDFICASENKATATRGGSATAAPSGTIIDTVEGVQAVGYDGDSFDDASTYNTILQSLSISVTKNNARAQYGVGSAEGRGIGRGTVAIEGSVAVYFRNFELYDQYKDENGAVMSFALVDDAGEGYVFSFPNVTLVNPSIVAGGPDTDLVASFTMEANPGRFVSGDSLFTMQIDKVVA